MYTAELDNSFAYIKLRVMGIMECMLGVHRLLLISIRNCARLGSRQTVSNLFEIIIHSRFNFCKSQIVVVMNYLGGMYILVVIGNVYVGLENSLAYIN
jgi:hypothetical protein